MTDKERLDFIEQEKATIAVDYEANQPYYVSVRHVLYRGRLYAMQSTPQCAEMNQQASSHDPLYSPKVVR
jgi:hypothetical protein